MSLSQPPSEAVPRPGIASWITAAGLAGAAEPDLLSGFCERLVKVGFPLLQGSVIIDTLHPLYEGRVFRWRSDTEEPVTIAEYGRTGGDGLEEAAWRRSPFFHLYTSGETLLHHRIAPGEKADYPIIDELAQEGCTDYVAMIHRFGVKGVIGEMDCVYSSWTSDKPGGFSDDQVAELKRLVAHLVLALRSASLSRIADTLAQTYLGRETGRRVLAGTIVRGVAEKMRSVIWFSDLRDFTRTADTAPPEEIIPFLNDYAEVTIDSVHEAGGEVLKLMGDGVLAIFNADDTGEACRAALQAEQALRERTAVLNDNRSAENHPVTNPYVALHVGEVFYGNIGSRERLDFTVVGPAVNETSRIVALCSSLKTDVLISPAFAAAASEADRASFVSIGRYELRGVEEIQELFTLHDSRCSAQS